MFKKVLVSSLSFVTLLCLLAAAAPAQDGNARKGKHLFRNSCRECHQEDAAATPLGPDSKTQAQWERAFKPENYQELQCKDEWAEHSEDDLEDMFTYLYEHAYDSPSPAKCK
jgi:mono/diheme cytochrome c family protein